MDKEKEVKKDDEEIKQEENETENKVEVLDVDIQKLKDDLDNTTDRLKRLMAEFDNYKKRSAKERDQLYNSLIRVSSPSASLNFENSSYTSLFQCPSLSILLTFSLTIFCKRDFVSLGLRPLFSHNSSWLHESWL